MRTTPAARALWGSAQLVAVAALGAAVAGLLWRPEPALTVLWNGVVPLVPASLLITPALWRNVCPLATVNMAFNRAGTRTLAVGPIPWVGMGGIALLFLLVPARRFLLNTNGAVLAGVILAVLAVALVLGRLFDTKAGFCNAVCPVLPVERLYGHAPLLRIANPRCLPCTLCTQRGCIDLGALKAATTSLGPGAGVRTFASTPFGLFAVAFPGFVIGYFTMTDVPLAQAGEVYLNVGAWTAGSAIAGLAVIGLLRLSQRVALKLLAGIAVGLYYWYAAAGISEAFAFGDAGVWTIRGIAATILLAWALRPIP